MILLIEIILMWTHRGFRVYYCSYGIHKQMNHKKHYSQSQNSDPIME